MENVSAENVIKQNSVFAKLIRMVRTMMAFEPVMPNIIAIVLGFGILLLLNFPVLFPALGKYHLYLTYAIYTIITIQTIKSATKSLFVPLVFLIIAGAGYALLNVNPEWHFLNIEFLKKLMLLGVIGAATTVFVI